MTETRKLAAILVADVVGYSRFAGADEEGTFARRKRLADTRTPAAPSLVEDLRRAGLAEE